MGIRQVVSRARAERVEQAHELAGRMEQVHVGQVLVGLLGYHQPQDRSARHHCGGTQLVNNDNSGRCWWREHASKGCGAAE